MTSAMRKAERFENISISNEAVRPGRSSGVRKISQNNRRSRSAVISFDPLITKPVKTFTRKPKHPDMPHELCLIHKRPINYSED